MSSKKLAPAAMSHRRRLTILPGSSSNVVRALYALTAWFHLGVVVGTPVDKLVVSATFSVSEKAFNTRMPVVVPPEDGFAPR